MVSVATENIAGHIKKIIINTTFLISYCLEKFVRPFIFKTYQAPEYSLGVGMIFFCIGVQVKCQIGIRALLWLGNRS